MQKKKLWLFEEVEGILDVSHSVSTVFVIRPLRRRLRIRFSLDQSVVITPVCQGRVFCISTHSEVVPESMGSRGFYPFKGFHVNILCLRVSASFSVISFVSAFLICACKSVLADPIFNKLFVWRGISGPMPFFRFNP